MATVTVEVNGRPYAVGCADGQEDRVVALARPFDQHVREVAGSVGHVGDLRLFLMAALLLADELHDARAALGIVGREPESPADPDAGLAEVLNAVAARIEKIAAGL
ncbi:MAG: cell division protein ZapA [Brevundimonas sp.]